MITKSPHPNNKPSRRVKKALNLTSSIEAAKVALVNTQHTNGYWHFELEADCTITAEYILMLHYLGENHHPLQAQMTTYLRRRQNKDGSYPLFTGGAGDLSCSVKVYFALKCAGDGVSLTHMVKLRKYILAQGGAARSNVFTRITLAMFEQIPWRDVPYMPVEIMLLPKWLFPFHLSRVSYWSRTVMVPLFVLCTLQAKAINPNKTNINELFTTKSNQDAPGANSTTKLAKLFMVLDQLGQITRPLIPKKITQKALNAAESWITERLNGEHGLGAIFPAMVGAYQALLLLGKPANHPFVKTARKAIDKLIVIHGAEAYCQPCVSPVWDTGFTILALQETNDTDLKCHLEKAYTWLKSKQLHHQPGDWRLNRPKLEGGGWPFQLQNPHYPDIDDTAAIAFAMENANLPNLNKSIERAVHWVAGMQSSNGGFGAFDCDNTYSYLNHIPFADHGALLDPPSADVSARCVMLLEKRRHQFPEYQKTIEDTLTFIRNSQEHDGCWFGRWGTNYIYGTWSVLLALEQTQIPITDPMYTKAVKWLKSTQNSDGGWGEDNHSYHDDSTRGQAEKSTSFQTAWAVLGLMSAKQSHCQEVNNGIRYLLINQCEDGFWHDPVFTAPGFPKVFYLKYHGYNKFFPLWALARYRNEIR
jgi:squalene-hopene/tetraprenyl-beta-curcumene cyclase